MTFGTLCGASDAHPREVKLGWGFTQTGWELEGYAIRDADSTTYTGAIETAEAFGKRLYGEAWKRGWSRADNKVVMGEGAEWIWNLAGQHFPGAVQIVDPYRARQRRWDLARKPYPNDKAARKTWMKIHPKRLLDKGKIEKLALSLRSIDSTNAEVVEKLRTEADYFERNTGRMRYPKFRRRHLFVGSGGDRSRLPDRHRFPPQNIRHVLDGPGGQLSGRPPMPLPQRPT